MEINPDNHETEFPQTAEDAYVIAMGSRLDQLRNLVERQEEATVLGKGPRRKN